MNFYRDFVRERLKDIETHLSAAAECIDSDEDEGLNASGAMASLANLVGAAALAQSMLTTMAAGTVYKIGQTYLAIDAVQDEDLRGESEAVAEIGRVATEEAFAAFIPSPIGIGHGYSHPAYPRVISRIPIRHIYRLGPQGLFNGCLYQHGGEALFSCRTQGFPSHTSIYRPNVDMLFTDPKEVTLPETFKYCSVEDMRIFHHDGDTLCCFTLAGQTAGGWVCQMCLGSLDENREFSWVHPLESPTQSHIEKNWAFFSCDDKLYFVYYPTPHGVWEVDLMGEKPTLVNFREADNWKAADFMEHARGGSPPVRIGDEFYHFYHTQHRHGRGVAYQTGLYTFDAKPPWNIRRIIKGPLLGLVPSKRDVDVIFVMSALRDRDRWNLSCGLLDQETVAISLRFDDVERLLEKVE